MPLTDYRVTEYQECTFFLDRDFVTRSMVLADGMSLVQISRYATAETAIYLNYKTDIYRGVSAKLTIRFSGRAKTNIQASAKGCDAITKQATKKIFSGG
jgi:hypothetical protein